MLFCENDTRIFSRSFIEVSSHKPDKPFNNREESLDDTDEEHPVGKYFTATIKQYQIINIFTFFYIRHTSVVNISVKSRIKHKRVPLGGKEFYGCKSCDYIEFSFEFNQ